MSKLCSWLFRLMAALGGLRSVARRAKRILPALLALAFSPLAASELADGFARPPASARPWVYWFWMDGNLSRAGITADLEAMQRAGIGGVIIMEVDVGVPRGPVRFMSGPWRELFKHVAAEAARLGLQIDLNTSPGWTGSGGPWIKPEQSMQKLVASETNLVGPQRFTGGLGQPETIAGFYRDVAALAFPTPAGEYRISDIAEKALYQRRPYSSQPNVKPFLPAPAEHPDVPPDQCIAADRIVDLTAKLGADGRLAWDVPPGPWTVLRLGRTSTGANTRPAPEPGIGLECDKFAPAALDAHFAAYLAPLLDDIGPLAGQSLVSLHFDSWEMGAQNWSARFPGEFQRRRGYDLLRFLPVMTGRVVGSVELSERFLWDLRLTAQELVVEHHARHFRELGRRHGLGFSIEPYDMNPCADLTLGAVADVPMCEFWARGFGFDTDYSCFEAVSIAHIQGRPVVAAEAFTATDRERWQLHPGAMKAQGDWAFCAGVNRLVFHRFAHQPWLDRAPGMTMGPYGVHWEHTQTWWDMVPAYHEYLARCQFLLQRGLPVADICYLTPEGAPHVFRPPKSALGGEPPSRLGYTFDGCNPETLRDRLSVKDGRLVLPDGMSYRLLVLPKCETMTPPLLRRIHELVEVGATVVGPPPRKSPSLSNHPQCDAEVRQLADELWGASDPPAEWTDRPFGKGRVVWGPGVGKPASPKPDPPNPLARAKWIWHPEGNPASAAPVGPRYFQRAVVLEAGRAIESAHVALTADNSFVLWVNGRNAGSGDSFHETYLMDVAEWLRPGTNLLAVMAENGGERPNPAGLIGVLEIRFRGGGTLVVPTDGQWRSAVSAPDHWPTETDASAPWSAVLELGPHGMAPWNKPSQPVTFAEIYPEYGVVARLLAARGVPPDFEADPALRYTHRREGGTDIYFVAHSGSRPLAARCAFRVSGKTAELWDPLTGRISRPLAEEEKEGRTFLPLWFEPAGSIFVVFRRPATDDQRVVAATRNEQNLLPQADTPLRDSAAIVAAGNSSFLVWQSGHYELKTAAGQTQVIDVATVPATLELRGPWEMRFQPRRGAPAQLSFVDLVDWSKHPDPAVRHFSGIATYRKTFPWPGPSQVLSSDSRLFLDLGRVQVMAQVKLNGRDLGVVWTAPFRVEVTDALKPGPNTLEIRVANLWPNRLIGDAGFPEPERVTWTTWNPFKPNAPLLESGLLGPVRLVGARQVQVSR